MRRLDDLSVRLTLTSPPYEDCRSYGMDFNLKGQAWVDWMIPRVVEMCRVTAGLVFVNMAGKVRNYSYQPVVEWLVADLTRHHGLVCGPAPYCFYRSGIPGSGGKHYHRRDWEPVYAFARTDCLPPSWSDNKATGHPPRWAPGGEMSYRLANGARVNQWGKPIRKDGNPTGSDSRIEDGKPSAITQRPSHRVQIVGRDPYGFTPQLEPSASQRRAGKRRKTRFAQAAGGSVKSRHDQHICAIANSGNVMQETYTAAEVTELRGEPNDVLKLNVGGGLMGDQLCHLNEAPFSEQLVMFFILSFARPGGIVFDPFAGSGTTCCVAKRFRRGWLGIDIRESQIEIARARLDRVQPELF